MVIRERDEQIKIKKDLAIQEQKGVMLIVIIIIADIP